MKIRSETMLGTSHSWAVTMRNLLSQFQILNHELFLKTTNGQDLISDSLKQCLGKDIASPDIDICYTLPRNFKSRFKSASKLKMAIYNYETSVLPKMWEKQINQVDYVLPSSNFSKEIFVNAGWEENKCIVVPHGINLEEFNSLDKFPLSNKKSFKFLNVSIPHYRKNIDIVLDAYYTAFSSDDDVCLILKTSLDEPKKSNKFEVSVKKLIGEAQYKHRGKNLPQIEIVQSRIPNMVNLYNSCDCIVSATSSEGFGLPLLEALAAKKLVIAPNCSGQLDFLNDKNSLLADVKVIPADTRYQYWVSSPKATTYLPHTESLISNMLKAFYEYNNLLQLFNNERIKTIEKFTWANAAKKILELK